MGSMSPLLSGVLAMLEVTLCVTFFWLRWVCVVVYGLFLAVLRLSLVLIVVTSLVVVLGL